jgi:hypothetical protein
MTITADKMPERQPYQRCHAGSNIGDESFSHLAPHHLFTNIAPLPRLVFCVLREPSLTNVSAEPFYSIWSEMRK